MTSIAALLHVRWWFWSRKHIPRLRRFSLTEDKIFYYDKARRLCYTYQGRIQVFRLKPAYTTGISITPSLCLPFPPLFFPSFLSPPFFPHILISSLPPSPLRFTLPTHLSRGFSLIQLGGWDRCELPQWARSEPGQQTVLGAFWIENHCRLIALLTLICTSRSPCKSAIAYDAILRSLMKPYRAIYVLLLFLVQQSGIHSHCLIVTHH